MELKGILLSVLGATTVGGVAVGGYYFVQPKYIKDLLLKENKKPLDTSENSTKDDEKWEKLVAKHNEVPPIKISGEKTVTKIVVKDAQSMDKNKLKKACQELFDKEIDKDVETNKENATNWCTEKSPLLV